MERLSWSPCLNSWLPAGSLSMMALAASSLKFSGVSELIGTSVLRMSVSIQWRAFFCEDILIVEHPRYGGRKWRRGRDSNPRGVSAHLISSQRRCDRFGTSPEGRHYTSMRRFGHAKTRVTRAVCCTSFTFMDRKLPVQWTGRFHAVSRWLRPALLVA